jgi:hypothetical protein
MAWSNCPCEERGAAARVADGRHARGASTSRAAPPAVPSPFWLARCVLTCLFYCDDAAVQRCGAVRIAYCINSRAVPAATRSGRAARLPPPTADWCCAAIGRGAVDGTLRLHARPHYMKETGLVRWED